MTTEDKPAANELSVVESGPTPEPTADRGPTEADPLAGIDEIESGWLAGQEKEADRSEHAAAERSTFADDFTRACAERLLPAMEAVVDRLQKRGGDGVITERPEELAHLVTHRLTLWMSLQGKIEGAPRQDRHPYLQFDARSDTKIVTMSEGDMWRGVGGKHSGPVAEHPVADLGPELVDEEVLAILRRAAG